MSMEIIKTDKKIACVNGNFTYASYILLINDLEFPMCESCLSSLSDDIKLLCEEQK